MPILLSHAVYTFDIELMSRYQWRFPFLQLLFLTSYVKNRFDGRRLYINCTTINRTIFSFLPIFFHEKKRSVSFAKGKRNRDVFSIELRQSLKVGDSFLTRITVNFLNECVSVTRWNVSIKAELQLWYNISVCHV